MAYERTEVPVAITQEALRKLMQAHKGFGLAMVSDQDPLGKAPSQEGFQAKVMIDNVAYVIQIMAKVKAAPKYSTERQKQLFKDQEERRIWRVLFYHLKSVFEAADSGVMEFRELMLPYIVLRNGKTIADNLVPRLPELIQMDPRRLLMDGKRAEE